jgi:hypothetical protein
MFLRHRRAPLVTRMCDQNASPARQKRGTEVRTAPVARAGLVRPRFLESLALLRRAVTFVRSRLRKYLTISVLAQLEKHELRIVVVAAFEFGKTLGRGEGGFDRFLDDDQRLGREPATGAR